MTERIILTDCDGVLLDWVTAFHSWMEARGYIITPDAHITYYLHLMYNNLGPDDAKKLAIIFNESAAIGYVEALRDSVYYVRKLHEKHGYRFRVITSLSTDKYAVLQREMNLRNIYGNAIESVVCLDTGADKDKALEQYRDSGLWWLEDKPSNSDLGHAIGLKSILVEHGHNKHHVCPYPVVKDWKEIYNIITAQG